MSDFVIGWSDPPEVQQKGAPRKIEALVASLQDNPGQWAEVSVGQGTARRACLENAGVTMRLSTVGQPANKPRVWMRYDPPKLSPEMAEGLMLAVYVGMRVCANDANGMTAQEVVADLKNLLEGMQ